MARRGVARAAVAVVASWLSCVAAASAAPPRRAADPQSTVRDVAVVHAGAGEQTAVVGQLAKGDVVTVDIELDGDDGHWCKVIPDGSTEPLGYVYCSSLERRSLRTRWKRVDNGVSGGSGSRATPPPAAGKLAPPEIARRPYSDVNVQLYYASWCPVSRKAKAFLESLGVAVTVYDIDRDPARKAELKARIGRVAVPLIDIEGIEISGFGEDHVRQAVEERRAAR